MWKLHSHFIASAVKTGSFAPRLAVLHAAVVLTEDCGSTSLYRHLWYWQRRVQTPDYKTDQKKGAKSIRKCWKAESWASNNKHRKIKSFPVCKDATGGGNRARRISFEVIFRPKSSFAEQTVFHCEYKSQPTTEGGTVLRAQEPTAHVQLASGASKQHGPAGFLSLRLLLHPKYSRVPPRTQTGDQLLIRHNFEDVSGRRALAAGGPDLFRRFYNGVSTDNANKSATQMEINL